MRRYTIGALLGLSLLLTACGSSAATGSSETVQVTLSDFKVATSQTQFTAGKTYRFVVKNMGQTAHEFMIMPQMANMSGMSIDEAHKMSLAMIDTVAVGETKTLDYTFKSSGSMPGMNMSQTLEFDCMLTGHYDAGMHTPITVNS